MDAAEEVFAKRGFGGTALEDIAEVAGYTRGAIYSHFGTKEELFLAVTERHLLRFSRASKASSPPSRASRISTSLNSPSGGAN